MCRKERLVGASEKRYAVKRDVYKRQFLMNANYRGMASFIKNRIVFYHVGEERESFLQLHSLLESLNVEVVFQQVPDVYKRQI